jgi:23S rRNA (cytidine1920-2'-O)/16S rRNA (cytidine1409-2'-O)-methyltransferase
VKLKKQRLDVLVMEHGLAESRTKAQALILAGQIVVNDQRVDKPGTLVPTEAELRLKGEPMKFVSRGGLKLEKALDEFKVDVTGAVCADIGASTGGFTDCLLQRGATKVFAIDVGYGQLHEKMRADPRVISRERVNARFISEEELPEPVDIVVMDVSFISITQVLPAVAKRMKPNARLLALVKPQFEAGREHIEKGGVVRDPKARQDAIDRVKLFVEKLGFIVEGLTDSPIEGPAGNLEALLSAHRRPHTGQAIGDPM